MEFVHRCKCGGNPQLIDRLDRDLNHFVWIECPRCHMATPEVKGNDYLAKQQAIRDWKYDKKSYNYKYRGLIIRSDSLYTYYLGD